MAERWEIVFDFSQYAGQTIQLKNRPLGNDGVGAEVEYQDTDKIMRFVVGTSTRSVDTSEVRVNLPREAGPELAPKVDLATREIETTELATRDSETTDLAARDGETTDLATRESGGLEKRNWVVDHVFHFTRDTAGRWNINGVGFNDVENRILADVPKGTKQIWQLDNRGNNWTHPVHVHLVDFQILHREGGRGFVQSYELRGLKDVAWLGRDEMVLVEATYNPVSTHHVFPFWNQILFIVLTLSRLSGPVYTCSTATTWFTRITT
jgi:FtsP/CotA-like multicopper oxidase with cupredoxin domain